jgi:transposase-like protein|tara:strand:- start:1488 stop:1847 length:360 start_codon:yes stop_codon:yes gene_type:complete
MCYAACLKTSSMPSGFIIDSKKIRDSEDLLVERGITVSYESIHDTSQYANNRVELSHEPTRVRERGMRKFKSMEQAQHFQGAHAAVFNMFNLSRYLVSAENYRYFRLRAFASWEKAVAI